jgi:hypothetical protein
MGEQRADSFGREGAAGGPVAGDVHDAGAEGGQALSEQAVQQRPAGGPVALQAIFDPRHVGVQQQVEVS